MNLKQLAGIEAAKFVKDGMIVGLGPVQPPIIW